LTPKTGSPVRVTKTVSEITERITDNRETAPPEKGRGISTCSFTLIKI
jgi:hypothetical protein